MKPARFARLRRAVNSVTGRTFLILSIGVTTAAVLSLALAVHSRRVEFEAMRQGEIVSRVQQIQARVDAVTAGEAEPATLDTILGVKFLEQTVPYRRAPDVEVQLAKALGRAADPRAGIATPADCLPKSVDSREFTEAQPNTRFKLTVECWMISFRAKDGETVHAAIFAPPFVSPVGLGLSPIYVLALLLTSALLSLLVARLVTWPLKRMSDAATAFSLSLDAPVPTLKGPTEVRAALSTFNIMQDRVREGLQSRTQLLASISHDLQTPLTRMRLRLEQVGDDTLRDKLVGDVQVMQSLVREGLDLARSHETQEPWSMVDIDSLVESLAEDAAEVGGDVRVVSGCGVTLQVRPNALARAVNNLIDNAVRYGGSAELSCEETPEGVIIRIRDHGPGLADPGDPRLFEPFYRLPSSTDVRGTGVGLTIARAQAALSGAAISLQNHPSQGLVATIILQRRTHTAPAEQKRQR